MGLESVVVTAELPQSIEASSFQQLAIRRSHCNNGQLDEAEAAVAEGLELAREFGKTLREAQGLRILAQQGPRGPTVRFLRLCAFWPGSLGLLPRLQLARGNHYQAMSSVKKSKKLATQDEDKDGCMWVGHRFA